MSDPIELRPIGKSAPPPPIPPRHPDSNPGSLGAAYKAAEEKAKAAVHLQEGGLDSISIWGLGASAWFGLLGIPLLLFPRILLFFAQTPPPQKKLAVGLDRDHYDTLTPLESFLSLSLALGLFAMALLVLFVIVPSYTPPSTNPSRWSTLAVIVGLMSVMSIISYNSPVGGLGTLVCMGNSVVAIWGWWVVAFGQGRSQLGKVTHKHPRWKKL